jgi:predicted nucleotidyltransferase
MYIFGSRARGDGDENSDYDFCIAVPKRFDLMDIGPLLGDLKDALGKKPILSAKTISIKGRTSWRKCYVTEGPYSRHDTEDLQAILKYCENIADIIWMSMSKE